MNSSKNNEQNTKLEQVKFNKIKMQLQITSQFNISSINKTNSTICMLRLMIWQVIYHKLKCYMRLPSKIMVKLNQRNQNHNKLKPTLCKVHKLNLYREIRFHNLPLNLVSFQSNHQIYLRQLLRNHELIL